MIPLSPCDVAILAAAEPAAAPPSLLTFFAFLVGEVAGYDNEEVDFTASAAAIAAADVLKPVWFALVPDFQIPRIPDFQI